MDLGFDSLMAVEFKRMLSRALDGNVDLPSTLVFDYPTIEAIAQYVGSQLEEEIGDDRQVGSEQPAAAAATGRDEEVASMSESQVEELLIKKLEGL